MRKTFFVGLLVCTAFLMACQSTERAGVSPEETVRANIEKAMAMMRDGRNKHAEELLLQALALDPDAGLAHNNLGVVYLRQGRLYQAAWQFERAAKLTGRPQPLNNLGLIMERTGQLDKAVAYYQQARKVASSDPGILGNLCRARVRRGDTGPEMVELLEELVMRAEEPEWERWAARQLALQKDEAEAP
jgi:Flp pilus assembly protein TadD